jgi:hypothetical protein
VDAAKTNASVALEVDATAFMRDFVELLTR